MSRYSARSIFALEREIEEICARDDLDRALRLVRDLVERIITEPLCTSQVFGSKRLDRICLHIGHLNFSRVEREEIEKVPAGECGSKKFVYVVTKLQRSGGHTRVIEDFIRARTGSTHIVLSTELEGASDWDYVRDTMAGMPKVTFEQAPKKGFRQRLSWLQSRLLEIRPDRAYLFNHHQDSVAVAAIQPEMGIPTSFYHHGDHHLCLGVHLPGVEHIDPHPMGYHNCRSVLGVNNVYVPLTVEDKGCRPQVRVDDCESPITTCTAGRSNKIEIPYYASYVELVPKIVAATGGRHIHIGRLSPWALSAIRRGLKRYGVPEDRFVYIKWVSSVWKSLHEHGVDLYIASFPYGGGLTLIEVMGAGVPVALHRHMFSRVLSGVDLAYHGAFSWRWPDELLDYCASVTRSDLEAIGSVARKQYEQFHSYSVLHGILNDETNNRLQPLELTKDFSIEEDERALWMARQMSIKGVFSRAIYRTLRRLRAARSW